MSKRRTIALAVVALLLALGVGWYVASPLRTLRAMQQAADAGDAEGLSAHVDYPTLRANVKEQLRERVDESDLGPLGQLLGGALAGGAVDLLVTPEGLRAIFIAAPAAGQVRPELRGLHAPDMALHRDGLNQFRLVAKDGSGGELVFQRHGLGWMLADIRLPSELRGPVAQGEDPYSPFVTPALSRGPAAFSLEGEAGSRLKAGMTGIYQ